MIESHSFHFLFQRLYFFFYRDKMIESHSFHFCFVVIKFT